jgi:hypothetical protein
MLLQLANSSLLQNIGDRKMMAKFLGRPAIALLMVIGLGSGSASAWLAAETSPSDKHHAETREAAVALLQQSRKLLIRGCL